MRIDTLVIVGVGLIGGSIGLAARERGLARRILGVGKHVDSLKQAAERGILDGYSLDLEATAAEGNWLVFCTPVDRIAEQVRQAVPRCPPGAILTDAGSTKANIVRDLEAAFPDHLPFVGSHPLAGSEKRGPQHARGDLFQGRITVVTPTLYSDLQIAARVREFWESLGSRVMTMDPESHNRALALTSHLPHLLASTLAGMLPEGDRILAATGFRDTTRIAAGDPELWAAIFRENALALCSAMERFRERFDAFQAAVQTMDEAELIRLLSQGKQVRDALGS